ncbi:MAG: prepilin-type N-terminal cleavage/methylation domain-containing protein [Phycisphaeraceae bacterium]|nr:prepilin-type N-terminal cleavage/methylation domain-containing protein [Phycisphaeraceae bacterium]
MRPRAPHNQRPGVGGFSLIELVAVMAILGVLSLTSIPALRSVTSAREGALARQLVRQLELARAFATATGEPTGLLYDEAGGALRLRRIASEGGAPEPAPDPQGGAYPDLLLGVEYPGSTVTGFVTGDGDASHTAVWFSFDGAPQVRDSDGALLTGFTQDAVISTSGGRSVTVRMTTGAIEG